MVMQARWALPSPVTSRRPTLPVRPMELPAMATARRPTRPLALLFRSPRGPFVGFIVIGATASASTDAATEARDPSGVRGPPIARAQAAGGGGSAWARRGWPRVRPAFAIRTVCYIDLDTL